MTSETPVPTTLVEVRVRDASGNWITEYAVVRTDLLTTRTASDRSQDDAVRRVSTAFTLAYGKAYPREPGKHRHRKGNNG